MSTYVEYLLEDGTTVLIETDTASISGVKPASRDKTGEVVAAATRKFEEAFTAVKKSAVVLRRQFEEMRADEVEVVFGLKAVGEAGNFAIGKAGAEANYTVTLKWKNRPDATTGS
ncbi:MAG: hypothetical protein HS126_15125 [Anaerolineales bacterium]|nr:hypothetical protein [Anaerolineales bacterium]